MKAKSKPILAQYDAEYYQYAMAENMKVMLKYGKNGKKK